MLVKAYGHVDDAETFTCIYLLNSHKNIITNTKN